MALISPTQARLEKELRMAKITKQINNSDKKGIYFHVPKNVHKKFKQKIINAEITISDFLNAKILEFIDKKGINK